MADLVLNTEQKRAVEHEGTPLLIVAGAGTGKTTVITEKIKYLITKKKVDPNSILALTFTEKAANEMLERLDVVMPLGYEEPWLGTFHGICDRLLKNESLEVGLDPAYKITTPVDAWILIKKHLFEFDLDYYRPLGNPNKFISALLVFFSRVADEDINIKDLEALVRSKKKETKSKEEREELKRLKELVGAYKSYQRLKIKESVLDFGDLIGKTLELFRNRPSILKKYQDQFRYILVDEFQDTNYSQYQLVKLLVANKKSNNLTVVGDDDQSIYKFRGAAISNILGFKKDFREAKEVVLTKNYRSVSKILASAYKLIVNNNPDRLEQRLGIDKKLKSQIKKKVKEGPTVVSLSSGENEVDFAKSKILELVAREKYSFKDFAILTRANSQLDAYVTSLKRAGIPYQRVGNRGLFDQDEVRGLIDFMRVVVDPDDSASLFHFMHFPSLNVDPEVLLGMLTDSKRSRRSLWELAKANKKKSVKKVVKLVSAYQKRALTESVSTLLHDFILETGYVKALVADETLENQLKIQNINLLFERIKKFETENKRSSLVEFVEAVDLWQEAGDNPAQAVIEDVDTVSLITTHSAKGLEFPVVFVGSMVVGRFPVSSRKDPIEFPEELIRESLPKGNEHIQEERRLLYVAITRAKHYLYLTYASDYGGVRKWKPSGFLRETELSEVEGELDHLQLFFKEQKEGGASASYLTKKGEVKIDFLSYSQIDTFLACPLKYKYRYILKVPAEPHHALSFGQTIHSTLHEFHRLEQQGKTPTASELIEIYEKNFLEQGYDSEEHKKKRFNEGKKSLKEYHKVFASLFGEPKMLERSFRLKIAGIPLEGKIDRVDETADGLEIVDYKTGGAKDQKQVDRDKQLTIYGLAAKEAMGIEVAKMSLFFVETGEKVTTTRGQKDYDREKKYLESKAKEIMQSSFKPKPGYPFPCGFCEYKKICPYVVRK